MSVEQSEHPERDAVAVAGLDAVDGEVAVGAVGNLVEGLGRSAHLEEVAPVGKEIAGLGTAKRGTLADLIGKEGLAERAVGGCDAEGVHEVGIAEEDLVGRDEVLVGLQLGGEQMEDVGTVEGIEHAQAVVARGLDGVTELADVGHEGDALGNDHEKTLGFLDGAVVDPEHGRQVALDDEASHGLQAQEVVLTAFAEEGVVAVMQVLLEVRQDADAACNVEGQADMFGQELRETQGLEMKCIGIGEVFAEGESGHRVERLAA